MAQNLSVRLNKAEAPSLGFRLQGGKDFGTPLVIQKVNIGSPAEKAGLLAGDSVIRVNNTDVFNLRHKDAQDVIIRAGPAFEITVQRGGSTWRPTVTPTASIPAPQPTINNVAPVTKTSLAAKPQPSIGAIGTGHNLSAKPFNSQVNGTVNGGPKLVNKQYNTPVGLYSEQSIAETLSAQAEVLSTGVLGVNFKKNEKNYDASNSAVFRMVQEADKAPRDAEPEPDSGVVTAPIGIVGLRHVTAPEAKATPPTPQLPPVVRQNFYTTHSHAVGGRTATPLIERSSSRQEAVLNQSEYAQRSSSGDQDMTKCTDCERVIVGVFVRIKDKNLHVECFKCSTCGASLKNVGYYNINNKLYCDVHAKLAARSNPPSENYLPVTVPPGKVAPAGAISAALASRPLPTVGPASPLSPSANVTAQPFQQSENANQVPMTELDGVDRQNEEDILNLVNSVTLAASKKKNTPGEKKFISETFIPINNNHKSDPLKISGPIPYNQYIAKTGTNFTGARPYSSVNSPLSPPINNYSTLPKAAPVSAPFSAPISAPAPGRSIQNIVWPPPPDEPDLPTATPLYFPPPSHVQIPSPPIRPPPPNVIPPAPKDTTPVWRKPTPIKTETREASSTSQETSAFSKTQASSKSVAEEDFSSQTHLRDYSESEELCNIVQNMDPKMSLCSSEVTSIVDRRSAVEHIETVAETQMFVESVMQQRPRSPPPIDQDIKPKVEVQTEPRDKASKSPYEPRVVTRVCVCTNSCCNASEGKLCESCPLRGEPAQLKRPTDYQKSKPLIENAVPRRYGSPLITGVSVTINNPGKIKESSNAFAQIPTKKTTTALGSALAVAPAEPFTPVSGVFTTMEPVPLPEETQPYFPPERPVTVAKPKPPKEEVEKPDTPFVSALKVAPERAFTPVGGPAPVRKKKPKEDPLLKDLPKPHQWMSMVTALTTASDRSYSPFISETVSKQSSRKEEIEIQETTVKTSQKELLRRSAQNETARPYTKPVIREKYEAVNDEREVMQIHFPPISDELKASFDYKADYSEIKSEISSQIIEQAHLEQESSIETFQESCQKSGHCDKESVACESQKLCCKSQKQQDVKQANVIAKQREETVLKKPLELAGNLHKPEYLPQYQMSLNYDETIQLPHHKDIRKLLPSDQSKQDTRRSMASKSVLSSQMDIQQTYVPPPLPVTQFKQVAPPTKPVTTIQPGQENLRATQMSFQPVAEERPPRTTFSPRPGSLTPSMINKPAPTLPYYQANLVATEHLAPEVNLFDPKSPAVSRSPSPCPEGRSSSPFPRQAPRPVSPAPGPPPNPLKAGQVPTFTKEDRMLEEAKKNITAFIPQYREKVESMQDVQADLSLAENMQTLEVRVPSQQTLAVQGKAGFVQSAQEQCYQKEQMQESAYKSQLMATATKQGSSVTSISESAKMQQMQQQNRMQSESVERSADNSVQIQRRRTVNEEYEHSQKSKVIEVKTSSTTTGQYPFQKVNNPQIEQQGILGLHVTNPQPIVSPFLSKGKDQVQQIQPKEEPQPPKPIQQPVPPPRSSSQGFNPTAPNLPNPVRSVAPPSVSTKATSSPGASANKPTVSQPNTGSGGGRQAGAIGVAPKRGRGVLNVGGLIGSRIPLCGHCHGSIRVFMFCCLTELGHGAERANATVERNDNAKAAEIIPTNPTTFNQINVTQNTPQYSPIFARRNSPLLAQPNRANTSELHQNVLSEIKNRVPKYDPPEKKVDVTDTQNGATKYAPPIAKNIDPSPFHKTDSKIVVSNVELKPSIDTLKHVSQQPIKYDGKNFVSGKVDIKLPNSETSLPLNELVTRADANNHAANFISQKIAMSVGLKPATQVSKETDTKVYKTIGTLNPGLINNVVPKLNHKNNTDISHNIPISNDTNLTTAPTYTDIPFSNNKYADHDFSDFTINTPTKIATENAPNNGMDSAIIENNKTNDLKSDTNPSHNKADEQAAVPICNVCNNEIKRGPFITALGKIWCPDHFICATPTCRRPLQDLGFVEEQGQLYCEYCFEQYLAPPCAKCNVKIKGDCLKAIGKKFHPECFNCSYCGKLFGNSPFFLEDGQPYCENDWNELFTTKCFACGFPVEAGDRWVEALNNNYHSQCFNCTMCKKNLEGQSFFAKGGRPFCKNHAR